MPPRRRKGLFGRVSCFGATLQQPSLPCLLNACSGKTRQRNYFQTGRNSDLDNYSNVIKETFQHINTANVPACKLVQAAAGKSLVLLLQEKDTKSYYVRQAVSSPARLLSLGPLKNERHHKPYISHFQAQCYISCNLRPPKMATITQTIFAGRS